MINFKEFKKSMQETFAANIKNVDTLYLTDVSKDEMWETYQNSFPDNTNPIFRERREYDCNCCKQFIRQFGNVVMIKGDQVVSIWDVETQYPFDAVAKKMSEYIKSAKIVDIHVAKQASFGTDFNFDNINNQRWDHFYIKLPAAFVVRSSESEEAIQGRVRSTKDVFLRALTEITDNAIETTLELINQNSLYRGVEFKEIIMDFLKRKKEFSKTAYKELYVWSTVKSVPGAVAHIRNSSIGTLLVNLSEGMDLDAAVTAFERVMAPSNYKRPNAIFTKRMIEEAEKTITALGLGNSLARRFAILDDITVNNVIYVNRGVNVKGATNVFEQLKNEAATTPKSFDKVEEIAIEDFIAKVLPSANNVEVLIKNNQLGNMMSLIAPQDVTAPTMFKWDNNFSWAYNGDITDSIKERVKAAGGNTTAPLRVSLSWHNYDDLDLHCYEPNYHIYFGQKHSPYIGGFLDVDMNAGVSKSRNAVENIAWNDLSKLKEGVYRIAVNNFAKREASNGFEIQFEVEGEIYDFSFANNPKDNETIEVLSFSYSKKDGIKLLSPSATSTSTRQEDIWGLKTNQFVEVSTIMFSPNYWDEKAVGNKHYFFMLKDCVNKSTPRGFFNEFLKEDLNQHRKVFEALGSKMLVEASDNQLSGIGFSSTQRNELIVKVTGSFSRILKIKF